MIRRLLREQSKEPRCELEHSKDSSAKTDGELTEVNRITLLGQRLNNLNKWLTRSRCPVLLARASCAELGTGMNINNSIIALKPHEIIE